jgi:sporulation protein YqfC
LSKKISEIKKGIVQRFELAPEAVGCIRLTVIDNTHAYLENYKNVIEYTQKRVSVNAGAYNIVIEGGGLELESFGKENVTVRGAIASIRYENISRRG